MKRKKRRGGRPRKQNVAREPNGRVSRSPETTHSFREAVLARTRLFGLTEQQATDAMAGTVVGRMVLQRTLSRDQFNAAQKYIEVRHAYLRAIGARQDFREPLPEIEGEGDYESFCRRARAIFAAMQEIITELCVEQRSPAPASALDHFVNRDVYLPHLEGDLRLALNRLSRYFFEGRKKVA